MRAVCVFVTYFRAKTELLRHADLRDRAFVVVGGARAESLVLDRSAPARGVRPGMTLRQAVSLCPDLIALDADELHYRSAWERLLDSLGGVSDMVEDGGHGEAYVRLDGLERLYGGETGIVSALLNAVPDHFNPRVGVANSKFVAYAAARAAGPMRAVKAPDDVEAFLSPLSIGFLPVSFEVRSALHRFGLRLLGDVASTSRTAMFDRFGKEGLFVWELSTGMDRRPFIPRNVEEPVVEHTTLPFSTTSLEMARVGLDMLLRRAFSRSVLRSRSVGAALLESSSSDGEPWKLHVRFRTPVERWERASELLGERLEAEPPLHPVDDLSLTLLDLGGEVGVQAGLIRDARESSLERLTETDRQLRGFMNGNPALYRSVEVAPWHPAPEMRSLLVPIDPLASDSVRALHFPTSAEVREVVSGDERRPAAVRVGRRWRDVANVTDRWKFDLWWLPQPMTRSYYRVESTDGVLTTLFRDEASGLWYSQAA